MWRAAGDTSTDYNFYTKRVTLSAVYSATLLAFLSDNSADMEETEAFLDRRLADVARLPKMARLPEPWPIWPCIMQGVLPALSCVAAVRVKLKLCYY